MELVLLYVMLVGAYVIGYYVGKVTGCAERVKHVHDRLRNLPPSSK